MLLPSWAIWAIAVIGFLGTVAIAVWLAHQLIGRCTGIARIFPPRIHREHVLWCAVAKYVQGDYTVSAEHDLKAFLAFVERELDSDSAEK